MYLNWFYGLMSGGTVSKIIITTRTAPHGLKDFHPGMQIVRFQECRNVNRYAMLGSILVSPFQEYEIS